MKIKRALSQDPHPLQDIVLRAFSESAEHDTISLAVFMAGCTSLTDEKGKDCMAAYRIVAEDVLGYLESQGYLFQDQEGWHRTSSMASQGTTNK